MSLINDALKRAKDSQKESAQPVRHFMPVAARQRGMSVGLIVMVGALLAAGCFFIGLALAKRNSPDSVTTTVVVTSTKTEPSPAVAPVAVSKTAISLPQKTPPSVATPVKTETPVVTGVSNVVVEAAPAEPPPPPAPKLQAVIFDPQNPTAIVNGKTAHINDVLGDFRVRAILQSAIIIEYGDGSTRRLNLGE